jgi:hypothetical protein
MHALDDTHIKKEYSVRSFKIESSFVREYISNQNHQVFGVAWNGHIHPNPADILGQYIGGYEDSLKGSTQSVDQTLGQAIGKRHQAIKNERLVFQRWGHMRNLQGRAYDPHLLPQDVTPDEIQ